MDALQLNSISYAYRSDWLLKRVPTIHDVSLTVASGESFGFLGHNGAGKTTAIKCILNLVTPQKGEIKILGHDSRSMESRKQVGYLPEQPYFYDHLTVLEIMDMYATLTGIPSSKRKSTIDAALEKVRLQHRAKSRMRSLSKGLTQRVAMAQAIVAEPRVLILDEPFSGLDPVGRKEFADLIRSLKREGTTIFMSSHVLSDVEQLCDRVSIMKQGVIQGIFSLADIQELTHGHYELVIQNPSESLLNELPGANETVSLERAIRLHYPDKTTAHLALEKSIASKAEIGSFAFVHGGLEELFVKLVQSNDVQGV